MNKRFFNFKLKNFSEVFASNKAPVRRQQQWASFNPIQKNLFRKFSFDFDRDKVPNRFDCQPMNRFKREVDNRDDLLIAMQLAKHIEEPCGYQGNNIREFYIREAKRMAPSMKNVGAREILEEYVTKYPLSKEQPEDEENDTKTTEQE